MQNNTISLYPNPAQEVLNVNSSNSIVKIEVYDLLGKKVSSNNNAKNLNFAALGKGVCIVKLVKENASVVTKQFIKEKFPFILGNCTINHQKEHSNLFTIRMFFFNKLSSSFRIVFLILASCVNIKFFLLTLTSS